MKRGVLWTLAQLNAHLDTRIDDTSDIRWTSAEKDLAIQVAIRSARGRWWEQRIDDTHTYDQDDFRYDLPPACEGVEAVYFAARSSDEPRYFVVPNRWHIEGDELVFDKPFPDYDSQDMYIHYFVYPSSLLSVTATDGAISSTTLTSSTSTFVTKLVREGDEVEIVGDTGGPYYVSSVTSETVLVLHKAPTAGTSKTFYVARYTDLPVDYIIYAAMAECYEMASRNRPGVEVEENIRWSTYCHQLAEQHLRATTRHMQPMRRY